ncbi:MAG: ATP phosphoribosyltransferase [Chloroflexi bacterium]|nr:ATP phosphoribosyltransferase [Chloroflexota bacterium]MDA1269904.1 ATP phosphoribosyltransferase [Chloroflexota bacterium]PKB59499.1 MAG: ATP phosphoribosyltransferase [SAR202 cluster bacterium Casp-Chloro-G2]
MTIQDENKNRSDGPLRIVLPSDGELYDSTTAFMRACGLAVSRPNARRYTGSVPAIPGVEVLFQRSGDVTQKVEEGSAELGVTGLDRVLEYRNDEARAAVLIDDLRYGRCEFVMAVPNSWMDVTSLSDLADLALEFRQEGKQLRIATKYPRLLRSYLYERGINFFTLVPASGAMEAAPAAGYADLIADLTATGATLRENQLKMLEEGTILTSQACLIANPVLLSASREIRGMARSIVELMEGHLRAEPYYRVTANVRAGSAEEASATVLTRPDLAGLRGPTVARVYNVEEQDWFNVSLLIKKGKLLEAVDHLRGCGAIDVAASQLSYLFDGHSEAYRSLFGEESATRN